MPPLASTPQDLEALSQYAACSVATYDLQQFDFTRRVAEILDVAELECLHEKFPLPPGSHGDQDTVVHRILYSTFQRWSPLYEEFVRAIVPAGVGHCFQRVPTFRIHYPETTATRAFHRDSEYNHQPGVINYWVPLTEAYTTNSIWLENPLEGNVARPVHLRPGQMLRFDATSIRHGSMPNETGRTRVSFDFRTIELEHFEPAGLRTVTNNVELRIGGYYAVLDEHGTITH